MFSKICLGYFKFKAMWVLYVNTIFDAISCDLRSPCCGRENPNYKILGVPLDPFDKIEYVQLYCELISY